MIVFLLIFFGIYGTLQAYMYWKLHAAYRPKGWRRIALIAFLLLMTFAPMLARMLDRGDGFRTAQLAALVSFYWMAVSMWVFCFGLVLDLWNLAVRLLASTEPLRQRLSLRAREIPIVLGVLVVELTIWGVIEAWAIRTNTITIRTPRLAPGSAPIRIVQICDLHLGLIVRERRLEHILRLVREARPDLLVCIGDLVDSTGSHMEDLVAPLADLAPPLGKFAVLGNHDFYADLETSLAFHEACGFRLLREESVMVDGRLRLVGVDDPAGAHRGQTPRMNEDAVLPRPEREEFTVLLKHRPGVLRTSRGRFDLQLSGHTHGGQVFPFTLISSMVHERRNGFFRLPGGAAVYVSRGAGTWGPPLRVFARPEITVFIIEPAGLAPARPSS